MNHGPDAQPTHNPIAVALARGYRKIDLAKALHVSPASITNLARGRQVPSWALSKRLARRAGLPAQVVYDYYRRRLEAA
jgi:DNA-binding XRE family transcriptional regulator